MHRLLWTISHRGTIEPAIAHRTPENGLRWAFFSPSTVPSQSTKRWGVVNFQWASCDQPNTDARVLLDNRYLRDKTCGPFFWIIVSSEVS